jgi:hypothetical protein
MYSSPTTTSFEAGDRNGCRPDSIYSKDCVIWEVEHCGGWGAPHTHADNHLGNIGCWKKQNPKHKNKSGQVKAAGSPTGRLLQNRGIQTIAFWGKSFKLYSEERERERERDPIGMEEPATIQSTQRRSMQSHSSRIFDWCAGGVFYPQWSFFCGCQILVPRAHMKWRSFRRKHALRGPSSVGEEE